MGQAGAHKHRSRPADSGTRRRRSTAQTPGATTSSELNAGRRHAAMYLRSVLPTPPKRRERPDGLAESKAADKRVVRRGCGRETWEIQKHSADSQASAGTRATREGTRVGRHQAQHPRSDRCKTNTAVPGHGRSKRPSPPDNRKTSPRHRRHSASARHQRSKPGRLSRDRRSRRRQLPHVCASIRHLSPRRKDRRREPRRTHVRRSCSDRETQPQTARGRRRTRPPAPRRRAPAPRRRRDGAPARPPLPTGQRPTRSHPASQPSRPTVRKRGEATHRLRRAGRTEPRRRGEERETEKKRRKEKRKKGRGGGGGSGNFGRTQGRRWSDKLIDLWTCEVAAS